MSIEFTCPTMGVSNNFPDAYAGVKFRCKHCSEFHTLPQEENYVHKDILSACPKTDEVVSIDSSLKTNYFKCAACGEIHEIPGEANAESGEIASSTKYQNQTRQKIIPSVRKRSLLANDENPNTKTGSTVSMPAVSQNYQNQITQTDRKKIIPGQLAKDANASGATGSRTNQPAVSSADLSAANKTDRKKTTFDKDGRETNSNNLPGSRTNQPAVSDIDLTSKSKTDRKRSTLDKDSKEETIRKPYKSPKKSFSFFNFLIIVLAIGLVCGIIYLFIKSEDTTSTLEELQLKYKNADKEASVGNFDKAIDLNVDIINAINSYPKLKEKINYKEVDIRTQTYKKQKETYKLIETEFTKILSNPLINCSGIEKAQLLLLSRKQSITGDINFTKPITIALEHIKIDLNSKHLDLMKQIIEKIIAACEDHYRTGDYLGFVSKLHDLNETFERTNEEEQNILKKEFSKRLKYFEEIQKSILNIETIYEKSLVTPLKINDIEKELKDLNSSVDIKDTILKTFYEQKLNLIKERKKIAEIKKIDSVLREKPQIKKELLEYLGQLNPIDSLARQELAKHLSRVSTKIHEVPDFQQVDLEYLKTIATEIGQTLNETQVPLTIKIDNDKFKINWQDENINYAAGLILIDNNLFMLMDINGIKIIFDKNLFDKNLKYLIRYARNLHDALLINIGEKAFSDEPWVVTEELLRLAAPAALMKTATEITLFLIDQNYKILDTKPFIENDLVIKQELQSQINKMINILQNSYDGLELRANTINFLNKMLPTDKTNLLQYSPNVTWLLETDFEKNFADPLSVKGLTELKNYWSQTFCKQTPWLSGTTENKTTLELFRVYGNRVFGRIYNPEKVDTSFLLTTADNFAAYNEDIALNFSTINTYQGNQSVLPEQNPIRIFTIHPLAGVISIFDSISNKLEVNERSWAKTFEDSNLFGKNGTTNTSLTPHALRINKKCKITEIYTSNFILNLEKLQDPLKEAFSKWALENKKFISRPDMINLLLLYCGNYNTKNNPSKNVEEEKIGSYLVNDRINSTIGATQLLISSFITNAKHPNIIIYIDDEFRNVWVENQLTKQFLCYYKEGFIVKIETEDILKDLRQCLQNKNNQYYSQYKIPTAIFNKDLNKWQFTNIPGILVSDILTEENRIEILNKLPLSSLAKFEEAINLSMANSVKEIDLVNYLLLEDQNAYVPAAQSFIAGTKVIGKEKTLTAKLEFTRLRLLANKENEIEKIYDEIYQNIITSDQFKNEPNKLTDVRLYVAKELATLGKLNNAKTLFNPENKTKIFNLAEISAGADLCFSNVLLFEKNKMTAVDYKTEIGPLQSILEKSFENVFESVTLDINAILKLNLDWVKTQASIKGLDSINQQLMLPDESKNLPTFGKELGSQQWNWARQNPLCYQLIIDKNFAEIDLDKEVDVKLKINISIKLIQAMNRNCTGEKSLWKTHPALNKIKSLNLLVDISESNWQMAAEKIKEILNSNHPEIDFYTYLATISISLNQNELNAFVENALKAVLPDEFFRKYFYNLLKFKLSKKARNSFIVLKEKAPNRKDLILDLEKALVP